MFRMYFFFVMGFISREIAYINMGRIYLKPPTELCTQMNWPFHGVLGDHFMEF